MALTLYIERVDSSTQLEIRSGTFKFRDWQSRQAGNRKTETLQLVAGGLDSAIVAAENTLADLLYEAKKFHEDPHRHLSVWMTSGTNAETPGRRTLLYRGELVPQLVKNISGQMLSARGGAFYQLVLERHPAWESISFESASASNVSSLGGKVTLVDEGGNLDGRIRALNLTGRSGAGGPMDKLWVGLRPAYKGSANFVAKWECEAGTNFTDAADTADASDSGGSKVRVSFATTATMAKRLAMDLGTFVTTSTHALGRYLVLLRGSVTSGVCSVQMRTGLQGSTNFAPHKAVYVSNTADHLIELGEISIPPFDYRSPVELDSTVLDNFQIQLWAERVSGAGSLDLDCIVLLPSEHFVFMSGAALQFSAFNRFISIFTFEDERKLPLEYLGNTPVSNLEYAHNNWAFPQGGGILIFAADRAAAQVVTDAIDLDYKMYPRWQNYTAPA